MAMKHSEIVKRPSSSLKGLRALQRDKCYMAHFASQAAAAPRLWPRSISAFSFIPDQLSMHLPSLSCFFGYYCLSRPSLEALPHLHFSFPSPGPLPLALSVGI